VAAVRNSDVSNYLVAEVLRDGSPITVRAIRPDDKQRLLRHFHGLSERSIYHRFFGHKRSLNDDDLRRLTELDFSKHVGLAATLTSDSEERFIGIGRYLRSADSNHAEVAFAVLDEYQGRGIGTLLLRHLARIARGRGIRRFSASVMGDNQQMLEVFANSGFQSHDSYDAGAVHVSLDLDEAPKGVSK
jgi:GNAT superfamily N-acetyltransferase